jgi:hypothetical protein
LSSNYLTLRYMLGILGLDDERHFKRGRNHAQGYLPGKHRCPSQGYFVGTRRGCPSRCLRWCMSQMSVHVPDVLALLVACPTAAFVPLVLPFEALALVRHLTKSYVLSLPVSVRSVLVSEARSIRCTGMCHDQQNGPAIAGTNSS